MSQKLSVVFIISLALLGSAEARLPRPRDPSEKSQAASIIVIAEVLGLERTDPPIWAAKSFARLRVVRIIKGKGVESTLNFITVGFSDELNPRCCVVGKKYLLFLYRGYQVFEEQGGMDVVALKDPKKYVSAADGAYSAYQLCGDKVIGWPLFGRADVGMKEVESQLAITALTSRHPAQ